MRIAVIVHVFYPELWPELAQCVRNVGGDREVFVTYSDEASVSEARRDFPDAHFVRCENRGYDVWPFLMVLQALDLGNYDCIVKLHTKRDVDDGFRYRFNHVLLNGSAWREYLLAFAKTPAAWRKTARKLSRPDVGLVADRHVIMRRRDVPIARTYETFDRAAELLGLPAERMRRTGQYVAGTMFAAKPAALRPILARAFSADDFEPPQGHLTETLAHVLERAMGLSVSAAGLRLAAFSGSLFWRRWF